MAVRRIGGRRPSEVRAAFRRAVRRQIRVAEGLSRRDLRTILAAFDELDDRLVRQIAITGIDPGRVQQLRDAARREVGYLSDRLARELDESQQRAARAGVQLVTEPLGEISPGLGVSPSIGLPPELASVASQFSADLIGLNSGGLASQVLKAINTEIGLAAIGGKTSSQAIAAISQALGSGGEFTARAHAIYRTEVLRVHSMASQAAMVKSQELVPTLRKAWLWSGISRATHEEAGRRYDEANAIPVDEPFMVDGEPLMYPRDPAGSPRNTVNCGCQSIPVVPDFGKAVDRAAA